MKQRGLFLGRHLGGNWKSGQVEKMHLSNFDRLWFIENSRVHAEMIIRDILNKI